MTEKQWILLWVVSCLTLGMVIGCYVAVLLMVGQVDHIQNFVHEIQRAADHLAKQKQ